KANQDILNVYFTAGFPNVNSTAGLIRSLEKAGADIIELGIPFSDPLADGPTIQQSSERALANGMTIDLLFQQLDAIRKDTSIPIIMMGYLNPIMQFGLEKFVRKAKEVGVDGFIFPDVPTREFEKEWKILLDEHDLTFSFLVTPQTSEARILYLDSLSSGFLYAVSSSSTTGTKEKKNDHEQVKKYLNGLKNLPLKNSVLAGFGISNREDYQRVNKLVDGAIIGSAFIKYLDKYDDSYSTVEDFVKSIKR
ncbi:tryptophan synthase subunit alpha, partial [Saprospiraceae bacterium]|nr:tryptophan synthase subunit alpha [Saprospiraceae bacterium]